VGSRAAAGTLRAGQMPVILHSSEVESGRGRTVEALAGFISAGSASGTGLGWRGVGRAGRAPGVLWRGQGTSNAWRCVSALVQTFAEVSNVRILAKILRRPFAGT
jgi:hypothetical protein